MQTECWVLRVAFNPEQISCKGHPLKHRWVRTSGLFSTFLPQRTSDHFITQMFPFLMWNDVAMGTRLYPEMRFGIIMVGLCLGANVWVTSMTAINTATHKHTKRWWDTTIFFTHTVKVCTPVHNTGFSASVGWHVAKCLLNDNINTSYAVRPMFGKHTRKWHVFNKRKRKQLKMIPGCDFGTWAAVKINQSDVTIQFRLN